jgi:hypothetical protein
MRERNDLRPRAEGCQALCRPASRQGNRGAPTPPLFLRGTHKDGRTSASGPALHAPSGRDRSRAGAGRRTPPSAGRVLHLLPHGNSALRRACETKRLDRRHRRHAITGRRELRERMRGWSDAVRPNHRIANACGTLGGRHLSIVFALVRRAVRDRPSPRLAQFPKHRLPIMTRHACTIDHCRPVPRSRGVLTHPPVKTDALADPVALESLPES